MRAGQNLRAALGPLPHRERVHAHAGASGAEDNRVPARQGQESCHAPKRRGVATTKFAKYPRTPHGPREPKLLMDVTPRILDRFDDHLGRGSAE
jgi:hypothetical protein